MHDHAQRRVEQLHPLVGNEAHARVLGHPRPLRVELGDDRLGLGHLVHLGRGLASIEAVRDPLGNVVPLGHARAHASRQPLLIECDHIAALPILERVLGVQEQLVHLATIGTHHHRQVGHDRRARVVHAKHQEL